jgi:ketosteroid isomerase-like protein
MSKEPSAALQVALAYYHAWTNKDFERAMSYIDEQVVCDAPAGRIEGAAAYREFMGPGCIRASRSSAYAKSGLAFARS